MKNNIYEKFKEIIPILDDIERANTVMSVYKSQINSHKQTISDCRKKIDNIDNYKHQPSKLEREFLNNGPHSKEFGEFYIFYYMLISLGIGFFPVMLLEVGIMKILRFLLNTNIKDPKGYSVYISIVLPIIIVTPIYYKWKVNRYKKNKTEIERDIVEKTNNYKSANKSTREALENKINECSSSINIYSSKLNDGQVYINEKYSELNKYTSLMPIRYMQKNTINIFKEYLMYGRANTVGECINIFEAEQREYKSNQRHKEILIMEEDRQWQQQEREMEEELRRDAERKEQEMLGKKQDALIKQQDELIKQNKEKIRLEQQRLEVERAIETDLERKNSNLRY